jgi:hypothetical protein
MSVALFSLSTQITSNYGHDLILPLTHSLTHSWSWALLEKPPIVQLPKNFPAFYRTRRFITVFTRALHWSLSWAISIQSIPSHPVSLVGCPRPLIQYIRIFSPYLDRVTSIRNLRTRHAVVTRDPPNMAESFHILLNSLVTLNQPFNTIYSDLLTLMLNKVQIFI